MTGLYWDADEVRVKSFAASSNKAGSTLKIELTITDPYHLASLLERLAEAQRDQAKPVAKAKPTPARAAPIPAIRDPAPRLALTFRRDHD